jgi:hypothetical protein
MLGSLGTLLLSFATVLSAPGHRDTTPRDTLVLAHEFTAPHEFARATLEAGQVYRVELTDAGRLQVRTLHSGEQLPVIARTEPLGRASRTAVFELAPSVTTTYEFRVAGVSHGAAPIRVYWDAESSARRMKVKKKV